MKPAVLLILVGLPGLAAIGIWLRIRSKQAARDVFLGGFQGRLQALGAEIRDARSFRWNGRTYGLDANLNPLFARGFDLRLSTFCDSVLEFEIRRARNVPVPLPEPLRSDALFRGCALDAPSPVEPARYLVEVRETLGRSFPGRWGAFSKMHCELVLSANRFPPGAWGDGAIRQDLETLRALAAVPAWREAKGGTWTFRSGFEPRPAEWHWKPEQRARLPEGARRWCMSCWVDNAYLNRPLVWFFRTLAGSASTTWLTPARELGFLEEGFGRPAEVRGNLVDLDPPEMAVAADQYLDGDFLAGILAAAPDRMDAVRKRFASETRFRFHDAAIDLLPNLRFYARRLYDDEFSWFSGEYEIVSAALEEHEVRDALESVAKEFGASVKEIDRPFSFKLLKEDRLDLSY